LEKIIRQNKDIETMSDFLEALMV